MIRKIRSTIKVNAISTCRVFKPSRLLSLVDAGWGTRQMHQELYHYRWGKTSRLPQSVEKPQAGLRPACGLLRARHVQPGKKSEGKELSG